MVLPSCESSCCVYRNQCSVKPEVDVDESEVVVDGRRISSESDRIRSWSALVAFPLPAKLPLGSRMRRTSDQLGTNTASCG
jgi:hypothetical protein